MVPDCTRWRAPWSRRRCFGGRSEMVKALREQDFMSAKPHKQSSRIFSVWKHRNYALFMAGLTPAAISSWMHRVRRRLARLEPHQLNRLAWNRGCRRPRADPVPVARGGRRLGSDVLAHPRAHHAMAAVSAGRASRRPHGCGRDDDRTPVRADAVARVHPCLFFGGPSRARAAHRAARVGAHRHLARLGLLPGEPFRRPALAALAISLWGVRARSSRTQSARSPSRS